MVEMARTGGGGDGGKLVAVTVIMVVEMRRRRTANVYTVQLTARPCAVLHIY